MRLSPRNLLIRLLSFAALAPAARAQAPAGGEFLVNTITTSTQTFPRVAADPSGAFTVAWFDFFSTPSIVQARRFDRSGTPLGAEFQVNIVSTGNARMPVVAADERGRFAVVWYNALPDGTAVGVFARVFARDGAPLGDEFRVSAGTHAAGSAQVSVVPGAFVGTWTGYGGDIYARRFDASGPLGPQLLVNTQTTGPQWESAVAGAPDGGFVVVWRDLQPPSVGAFGQRFDREGSPRGAQFKINTSTVTALAPKVAGDDGGNFVVIWQEFATPQIRGRRFDAAGAPVGAEFVVNTFARSYIYEHALAADRSGGFVVTWEARDLDGDASGIFARRYAADATPRGPAFQVNTSTTVHQVIPAIASDGAGNLTAVWMSSHFSQGYDIFGQRYGGLVPDGLTLADGNNGVLEIGDAFTLTTSWRNVSGTAQTFQGRASSISAPAGVTVTLSPDADYGTVADGAVGTCSPCFSGTVAGTRPAGHADAGVIERILPDVQGQSKRWTLHLGESFTDVPRTSLYYRFVETLLHRGVTGGCGADTYCPAGPTAREQMSVFVLVAKEGAGYLPRACTIPVFGDVPAASPFCRWIEELFRRGVVGGCGGGDFCPSAPVTREEMAVFVLRTLDPALDPPACTTPVFQDVPASSPFCRWIEELWRRGVVTGCGGGNYCPTAAVTREQMGVFISATFGLALYGP